MIYRPRRRPHLIAHKGDSWGHPENTVAAIESAIAAGVDMVEIDVSTTADGVAVVVHGPRLEHSTTGRGRVRRVTYETVATARAFDRSGGPTDATVPRLADVLDAFGTATNWNLDLKDDDAIAPTLETIHALGLTDRCVVSGSTHHRARRVLRRSTDVGVLLDLTRTDKIVAATPLRVRWLVWRYRKAVVHPLVVALNVPASRVDRALVAAIHGIGGEVWTYTVDDQAEVDRLVACGVDSITTNRPGHIVVRPA